MQQGDTSQNAQTLRRWAGVPIMVLLIGGLEGLEYAGFTAPMPAMVLLGAVAAASIAGGALPGLVCAAMLTACAAFHLSTPGHLFRYTAANAAALLVTSIVAPGLAIALGALRRRALRAPQALQAQAVLAEQLAQRRAIQLESERQRIEQETIFHSVPAMIWFKDKENRILRANRLAAASIGRTVEEVEGRSTAEFYPDEAEEYLKDDLEVINSGVPKLGITEMYRVASGERRWVRTDKLPYRDAGGNTVGVIVFAVDITEQKRAQIALQEARDELERRVAERTGELRRSNETLRQEITERQRAEDRRGAVEHHLQQIIDNTTAVIYLKDPEGRYLLVNRRFEELFHVRRPELAGRTDHDLFPKPAADAFRANDLNVLRTATAIEFEETAPHDDGPHDYISLKFPLLDAAGHSTAVCGISTDITDRKRAEQAARKHTAQLEQANLELAAAREAAEAASGAKSRFLANISHEIRTPIMAMLGAAELLQRQKEPGGELDHGDIVLRNGRHLLSLVDELLDVSRIEAGKLDVRLAPCSLLELLRDVEAVADPTRRLGPVQYRLCFETPVPTVIRTDRTRLTQALINLVNNAFKFTREGSVEVHVRADQSAPDPRLVIEVRDTGVGIRPEDRDRIFESFAQVQPVSRGASAGAGLGLPIAKWIAERLGGSLDLASEFGRGSQFTLRTTTGPLDDNVWITAAKAGQALRQPDPQRRPTVRAESLCGRVLLAEDAEDTRDLIAFALRQAGVEIVTAANGREAVERASEGNFDLILLDIRMPELDGLAAAREIRGHGFRCAMVALTASTSHRERERILSAGFDDVWSKPIALDQLVERAGVYLASRRDDGKPCGLHGDDLTMRLQSAIEEFRQSLPLRREELARALDTHQLDPACEILHRLVGSAGVHGFGEISTEAARLLSALRAAEPRQASNVESARRRLSELINDAVSPMQTR